MEEIVRVKVMYLDNLLKQLINYKKFKSRVFSDDAFTIRNTLLAELQGTMTELTEKLTRDGQHMIDEKYFNGKALKTKYEGNWRLLKHLSQLEFLRDKIYEECSYRSSQTSDSLKMSMIGEDSTTGEVSNDPQNLKSDFVHVTMDDLEPDIEPLPKNMILNVTDYDKEVLERENKHLRAAYFLGETLKEMQSDFDQEVHLAGVKLGEAQQNAQQAAEHSKGVVKEVKKKAKSKWTWLPLKLGALLGVAGGASGAIFGNLPGAAIGSASGTAGGVAAGGIISANMADEVDQFEPESPVKLER